MLLNDAPVRILHVVDRVGGGVPVAVRTYIENSPSGYTHAVVSPFDAGAPSKIWRGLDVKHFDMGSGLMSQIVGTRQARKQFRPGVVHAHSSFAGVFARITGRSRRTPIMYSPHCFAFERQDLSAGTRRIFRFSEWLLAFNTSVLVACSTAEKSLAERRLPGCLNVEVVPNVPSVPKALKGSPRTAHPSVYTVGMLGRVSPQKDPKYFTALLNQLRDHVPATGVWIGSGDDTQTESLRSSEVEVTGWGDSESTRRNLRRVDVYLHSAAWEGFPIAVLDAHATGLPILVRKIRAFVDVPDDLTIEGGLSRLLDSLTTPIDFLRWADENVAAWSKFLAGNSAEQQTTALERVWKGSRR